MLTLLHGIRVLDATRWLAGAEATSFLADLGAEVVMLERPPRGNQLRGLPPEPLYSLALDRNKRSLAIDIGDPAQRPAFERLVASADVFVESSRPGVMRRLRADYDALRTLKPDLVYCSLTAWGQTGPYRDVPAHALGIEAAAALAEVTVDEDGRPRHRRRRGAPTPLPTGAAHAAIAVLAALLRRGRTGEGAYLDVSLWDVAVAGLGKLNLTFQANGAPPAAGLEERGPRQAPYRAADGKLVFLDFVEPAFWERFCSLVGRPDLRDAPEHASLEAVMATRPRDEWIELATREGLPITPVLGYDDLRGDPHAVARDLFLERDGATMLALPIKVAGEEFDARRPPGIGADTQSVLGS